jgi:LmbE family N-acetylglucosaminyl deacetylase
MTRNKLTWCLVAALAVLPADSGLAQSGENPLRVLLFGAHPDDPEKVGGTMAKFVALGHQVRLVSLTNGNVGHFAMGGGPLAQRRYRETQCAGRAIGAEYVVLDNDDGKLMPTLENREEVIRQIREFRADIVISPRPNDYHPDHRNTGQLVMDAAYMVTVPNIVPLAPHLRKNPVFLYMEDRFTEPSPFVPDLVVAIDDVLEQKIDSTIATNRRCTSGCPTIRECWTRCHGIRRGGASGSPRRGDSDPPDRERPIAHC